MNIPPLLEKLLLSNEAVFKNASLGMGGANMVFVPPGKTAVLLEVSIEPFVNVVDGISDVFFERGYTGTGDYFTILQSFLERLHFQLQIINDKYSTYISLNEKFEFQTVGVGGSGSQHEGHLNINFSGKREELFIYIDRSTYFNIIYPGIEDETNTSGLFPNWGDAATDFIAKIQTIPQSPVTFAGNPLIQFLLFCQVNSLSNNCYYPVGYQTTNDTNPQMEYLRFVNNFLINSIQQPQASGADLLYRDLLKIPFINVKYALLNKRPDDYGITMPKKK